jgi:hypothetical protein
MASKAEVPEQKTLRSDYSSIPQSVVSDATELAGEIAGKNRKRRKILADQMLLMYVEARDMDILILFNSGGWGWNHIDRATGWKSIIEGIKSEVKTLGYGSLVLNYQRTSKGVIEYTREFSEELACYPKKARELVKKVEFLTSHLPGLRIILAGESTGTIITDKAMGMLQHNTRVYSIQTGNPFWYKPVSVARTLIMNSNGTDIDTFSYGKILSIVWANVKRWFIFLSSKEKPGTVLTWLRAPGHDYSWQYPGVQSEVINFLQANFQAKE